MFCMLLRKHLAGARLVAAEQPGLERIVALRFEASDELGDRRAYTLQCELFGRLPNLVLLDSDGRILDAVRRVNAEEGWSQASFTARPCNRGGRILLPGAHYQPPEPQRKISLLESPVRDVMARMDFTAEDHLDKALNRALDGASPIVCREIAFRALRGRDIPLSEMGEEERARLAFYLGELAGILRDGKGRPTMVLSPSAKPMDFTYMEITQYGRGAVTREMRSGGALLADFYAESDRQLRLRRRTQDLMKVLTRLAERTSRRVAAQQGDLAACRNRDQLRRYGELITANLHALKGRQAECEVVDYYDPACPTVRIPLDERLSPAANAQRYFKDYRRAETAERMLTGLIQGGERELAYYDTVFDALARCETERDAQEIREELHSEGILRREKGKARKPAPAKPLEFEAADGTRILVGRNNRQNEEISLRLAKGSDTWLHVKDRPGAHVLIQCGGQEPSGGAVEMAAALAVRYSSAAQAGRAPVDVTLARHVWRQPGGKTGMVLYDHQKTIMASPYDRDQA